MSLFIENCLFCDEKINKIMNSYWVCLNCTMDNIHYTSRFRQWQSNNSGMLELLINNYYFSFDFKQNTTEIFFLKKRDLLVVSNYDYILPVLHLKSKQLENKLLTIINLL